MIDFQEFPKWLYGPNGVSVIVDDKEQMEAQLAEWKAQESNDDNTPAPRRGRPPKVR